MLYPDRGDGRKTHYGDGKQPWDTIRENGWEIHWLAGNIVKYLRRTKDPEHSYESAQIYWKRLLALELEEAAARYGTRRHCLGASEAIAQLRVELTEFEMSILEDGSHADAPSAR